MTSAPGTAMLMMPVSPDLEGRQGFLYGGVIASLLELTCLAAAVRELGDLDRRPRPINMSLDFLRGGHMIDTYAEARIIRLGKHVANAEAICWQGDRERPIASGRVHLLMD
ncbi:PaaI family thioesterase [Sphingobium sp. CAP-1]|uniref:PaaI family thioesterase n=1 Tax=Sphingobium sp. CAP-1 TaxID=2676077 RepID=UPI001E469556|nr:PaaI family thioesterase [Sphingobium sp. CAP-1]